MLFSIFCLLVMAYAVAVLFPETKLGTAVKARLIEGFASYLNKMTWRKAIYLIVLSVGMVAFSYAALPAELAMMAAADWALYAEIAAALTVTNMSNRLATFLAPMRQTIAVAASQLRALTRRPKVRQSKATIARRAEPSGSDDNAAAANWVCA